MNIATAYQFNVAGLEYIVTRVNGEAGAAPFYLVRVISHGEGPATLSLPEEEYRTEGDALIAVLRDMEARLK